jgi:transposase InsO family protein
MVQHVPFGQPEIWNSDQGSQFTGADFLAPLKKRGVTISMDGRGRALDNVFIERLWRSLKYELIYPGDFASGANLYPALDHYLPFLQLSAPAPGARLPHAGRSVPAGVKEEKGIAMMGGSAPDPPGIYRCFPPEWMIFSLPVLRSCRIDWGLRHLRHIRKDAIW